MIYGDVSLTTVCLTPEIQSRDVPRWRDVDIDKRRTVPNLCLRKLRHNMYYGMIQLDNEYVLGLHVTQESLLCFFTCAVVFCGSSLNVSRLWLSRLFFAIRPARPAAVPV